MKRINAFVFAKIVEDCPTKLEVSDTITEDLVSKTQSEIKKWENLCGSKKIEATNNVNEDNAPTISLNYDHMFDLNQENPCYCNSSMTSDCDVVFTSDDLEFNDTTIQGEDSEDSEKTIKEESLLDDRHANSSSKDLDHSIDSTYEKVCRIKHCGEKFVDSGISLNSISIEDNNDKIVPQVIDDLQIMAEKCVSCKNIVEDIKNKETRLGRNIREEPDVEDIITLNIESNNYYIDNNESYLKDAVDLLKSMEENTKGTLKKSIEENSTERITETKEMDQIIKNLLYTNDDEQHDSVEERIVESLSAELESNHDDMMRKIIESCFNASINFQEIRENSTSNFEEPSNEYIIEKFGGNKFFSHYRDVSDAAIEKEDILKTIEEAEKILTDNPYNNMSETSVNNNYDKDNSSERLIKEVKNDEEDKTENKEENNFVENKDTQMNLANVKIEKVVVSESNVIDSNLQKLAEITYSDRPKSHVEIHETIEKIVEEKRKIENRKKESLETLSKKFEEIDKFIADRYDISYASDKDPREFKIPESFGNDSSDSLDDFQIDTENVGEVPLTKAEITENLKLEELEKELANEMEEHKKLMDEYQKIIATNLEEIQQVTLESESKQIYNDEENDKDIASQSRNDTSEELDQVSEKITDTTAIKIDSESDDSFSEDLKEPERTYIKGKVYDFDEKKHGVR